MKVPDSLDSWSKQQAKLVGLQFLILINFRATEYLTEMKLVLSAWTAVTLNIFCNVQA